MSADRDTLPAGLRIRPLAVFLIWTLYGVLLFSQMKLNAPPPPRPPWKPYGPFLYWVGSAWAWAALTPIIAVLLRRFRLSPVRARNVLVHLAAVLVFQAFLTLVDAGTFYFVSRSFPSNPLAGYPRGFVQTILLYSLVAVAVIALDHARTARERERQTAQLEADLARARLDTLRRQIQPHFLFNTLNTISELIDTDPPRAGIMVTRLGELLRRSLDDGGHALVRLESELEFVRLYTDIERVRFESWLSVREEVDDVTRAALVPPMILQPLVENAIKHGIAPLRRAGTIVIRAEEVAGARLRLEVIDDGVGVQTNGERGSGIGLATTRARLQHIFGDETHVGVVANSEGTTASLELPFVTEQPVNGSRAGSNVPSLNP